MINLWCLINLQRFRIIELIHLRSIVKLLRFERTEDIWILKKVLFIISETNVNTWNISYLTFSDNTKCHLFVNRDKRIFAISRSPSLFRELSSQLLSAQRNACLDISINHSLISFNTLESIRWDKVLLDNDWCLNLCWYCVTVIIFFSDWLSSFLLK